MSINDFISIFIAINRCQRWNLRQFLPWLHRRQPLYWACSEPAAWQWRLASPWRMVDHGEDLQLGALLFAPVNLRMQAVIHPSIMAGFLELFDAWKYRSTRSWKWSQTNGCSSSISGEECSLPNQRACGGLPSLSHAFQFYCSLCQGVWNRSQQCLEIDWGGGGNTDQKSRTSRRQATSNQWGMGGLQSGFWEHMRLSRFLIFKTNLTFFTKNA